MAGKLPRFLHLERARPEAPRAGSHPRSEPEARSRFDALEDARRLPEAAAHLPPSAAERFRTPEEGPLALDLAPEGEQPFVRCSVCEADHARHTARCGRCGAALDTPEQRAFNERLWAARRREAEEEARAGEERREEQRRAGEEEARERRALAESMAAEILRREREKPGESWPERASRWLRWLISRE